MLSSVAVNSLGEMVSACLTPLLILIFISLCRCTVTELSEYMSFRISTYTYSIPCSCNDVDIAWVCTESNAFSQSTNATHSRVLYSRHFSLSWFMACIWSVVEYLLLKPACSVGRFSSLWTVSTYLTARKLIRSYWCIFCSLSRKIKCHLICFLPCFRDASFCYALCVQLG